MAAVSNKSTASVASFVGAALLGAGMYSLFSARKKQHSCSCGCSSSSTNSSSSVASSSSATPPLRAQVFDSGFPLSHDTYNGMGVASDGRLYYVLSSESYKVGAQMYCFDPASNSIACVGDLSKACAKQGQKPSVSQGKSHVPFFEHDGYLYFSTHIGYYTIKDGSETPGVPPAESGVGPYEGGHFLRYHLASKRLESLCVAPHGEGILTTAVDGPRGMLFGITWPSGYFITYDMGKQVLTNHGLFAAKGESVRGPEYRTLCRAIGVDPRTGHAFFTNADGDIFRWTAAAATATAGSSSTSSGGGSVGVLAKQGMRKDYFGQYDPSSPGTMAYNWRQIFWYSKGQCFMGVHGNSGYLFEFHPDEAKIIVLDRLTSMPSRRRGMWDLFTYGYLGFALGPNDTIYYLTGGPIEDAETEIKIKEESKRGEAKGEENLHLITYHITQRRYKDHGPITLKHQQEYTDGTVGVSRPMYVNSVAVAQDGTVYSLARVRQVTGPGAVAEAAAAANVEVKTITDLIRFNVHV